MQPEVKLKKKRKHKKKKGAKGMEVHNSHLFYKDFEEEPMNTNMFEVRDCGI